MTTSTTSKIFTALADFLPLVVGIMFFIASVYTEKYHEMYFINGSLWMLYGCLSLTIKIEAMKTRREMLIMHSASLAATRRIMKGDSE